MHKIYNRRSNLIFNTNFPRKIYIDFSIYIDSYFRDLYILCIVKLKIIISTKIKGTVIKKKINKYFFCQRTCSSFSAFALQKIKLSLFIPSYSLFPSETKTWNRLNNVLLLSLIITRTHRIAYIHISLYIRN